MPDFSGIQRPQPTVTNQQPNPLKARFQAFCKAFSRLVSPVPAKKHIIHPLGSSSPTAKPLSNRNVRTIPHQLQQTTSSHRQLSCSSRLPAQAPVQKSSLCTSAQDRLNISRERITEQFLEPDKTSRGISQKAWELYHLGHSSPWGTNTALLSKAHKLGRVSTVIENHSRAMTQVLSKAPSELRTQGQAVINNLQSGMNELNRLLSQPGAYQTDPLEQQYLNGLYHTLHNQQKLMLQVIDDPGISHLERSLSLKEGMELKRLGYDLTPALSQNISSLNDTLVLKGSEINFGSGAIHSVTRLSYQTQLGAVDKVFKGEDPTDPCPFDSVSGLGNYLDRNKPRFAARNFAAARMDSLLNTGLMPKMELAVHDGQMGILMDVAKGVKPFEQQTNRYNLIPVEDRNHPQKAATIQQNLNSAEWLDGICGQQDRHPGNLFVDPLSGSVTLIDNDISFYPGQSHVRSPSQNPSLRRFSGSTAGLPAIIDAGVYEKLMAITPTHIRGELNGLLTTREIEATVCRVNELQQHADSLAHQGRIVYDWQQWQDPATDFDTASFQRYYAPDSYLLSVQGQARGL